MRCNKIFIFLLFLIFLTCGTSKNAKYDVLRYSANKTKDVEKYLVRLESYTTNGAIYHKKYKRYLAGVARILIEEKKLNIVNESLGFYFDKKESSKTRLYLGLDINVSSKEVLSNKSYEENGRKMIKVYSRQILEVLYSCLEILEEDEVYGMVVGMYWKSKGNNSLNIWIEKNDVNKYYNKSITFNELVFRSTVTNSKGKIIRLTL